MKKENKICDRIREFINDRDGSEAVEMVYTTASLMAFILVALMVFSYVFAQYQVTMVTRRICRNIEVTGQVPRELEMLETFKDFLSGECFSRGSHEISVYDVHVPHIDDEDRYIRDRQIQLTGTFTVTGKCEYVIQLLNPGSFTGYSIKLPLASTVTGMSEVYFGA